MFLVLNCVVAFNGHLPRTFIALLVHCSLLDPVHPGLLSSPTPGKPSSLRVTIRSSQAMRDFDLALRTHGFSLLPHRADGVPGEQACLKERSIRPFAS